MPLHSPSHAPRTQHPPSNYPLPPTRIGWGALIIAGGGAYYYAKRDIDASRREKFRKLQQQQQLNANLEYEARDLAFAPSAEAAADPAPVKHQPDTDSQRDEKSKYEAAVPYRSRTRDRFS